MAKITIIRALKKLWNAATELLAGKQDKLRAGSNIIINDNTISAIIDAGFRIEIVQSVPSRGLANTIYFVPVTGGTSPNVYDEYMFINGAIEKIGSTEIDLSNYYNKTQVDNLLAGKQGTLTAGANINITYNTIKAEGYTYNPTTRAFAVGYNASATGLGATAFGASCVAAGDGAAAIGSNTRAVGINAGAFGGNTIANGNNSFTFGRFTISNNNSEGGLGSYNKSHSASTTFGNCGNTALSIGIGTADNTRKNAVEVMQNGDAYLLGVGNYDGIHIKGQSGAPTGLRTLQEVVNGLRTDLENGLKECQKTVYPYARFDEVTGEVTGDYPDGGEYYNEDESYFEGNYIGAYSGNGGRVVCVRPWRITELITNDNTGVPIELLLVDPMYDSVDEWYANREYIIRVVCDGADGNLSVPSSIRWATPQIHRDLAEQQFGISIDDYAYMPPLRDGHTYDIHILNGVAWWVETPNA